MAVAPIVATRNRRKRAQLRRGQQSIRNGDPQHRGMPLDVQTIAQTQRTELIFVEFTGEKSARLITKLCDALIDQRFVDDVISIHIALF